METKSIRDQFTPKRSSTRTRKMSEGVRQRKADIDTRFGSEGGADRAPSMDAARRVSGLNQKDRLKLALGSLGAAGVLTLFALAVGKGKDAAPVNVDKLPADQVSKVTVSPDSPSHLASGVAGDVMNHDANLNQITAEIEKEVGGDVVPAGTELKLPANQIDPAAVEKFEHGQNG